MLNVTGLSADIWSLCAWHLRSLQVKNEVPHFLHAFAVCCLWTFVSTMQLLSFLSRASFLVCPDLSNSSGEKKPNPSCMTTTEERRVPAQLDRFFWGMTKADSTCTSFAVQRWHDIFADASWSGSSPRSFLFCSITCLRAIVPQPLGTLWEWLPFAS